MIRGNMLFHITGLKEQEHKERERVHNITSVLEIQLNIFLI